MSIFAKPVTDIIQRRFSCRTYLPTPIPAETLQRLQNFIENLPATPFGTTARFCLAAASEQDNAALKNFGTYGFIHGATGYVIGAASESEKYLEDFGWQLEVILLFATHLGLGSCWLGGTFTRSTFAQTISLREDEIIPAVAAIGGIPDEKKARTGLIRQFAQGANRHAWEKLFFSEKFGIPLPREQAGDFATPLDMLRWAPSASNKQPWRVVRIGDDWHFYLQRTPGYRKGMFQKMLEVEDLQRVDMGIGMSHFELTAKELGLPGGWNINNPEIGKIPPETEYLVSWKS